MSDPRETPFNGRVAHVSLKGVVEAEVFAEGEMRRVSAVVTNLCSAPGGIRERELIRGEAFRVLETVEGWSFGIAARDGYVGWIEAAALAAPDPAPTHIVCAPRSYAKAHPELKRTEPVTYLPFGARLAVLGVSDGWARVGWLRDEGPAELFVPEQHLRPAATRFDDPVAVARLFLGTPYLWGGNSAFGIDCSGLVQAALLTCGLACPGDSNQQRARVGTPLGEGDPTERGDLIFWQGHVGMVGDGRALIHATAHAMSVVEEPLDVVIERIATAEGKPVLCRRRISPPRG